MTTDGKLGVGPDAAPLIFDMYAAQVSRTTFLREICVNALDAGATEVRFGFELVKGVRKLIAVDDGVGFDPTTMADSLCQMFRSGHAQGAGLHWGMGLKLSSLPFNHGGVEYFTKRDAKIYHAVLEVSSQTIRLRPFQYPDGVRFVHEVGANRAPSVLRDLEHGTAVVFHGMCAEEDTYDAPAGVASPRSWVAYALNDRLASLPEGARVRFYEPRSAQAARRSPTDRSLYDWVQVNGLSAELGKVALRRGTRTVSVKGCDELDVDWFTLPEATAGSKSRENVKARVAAVYHDVAGRTFDELYESLGGDAARRMMRHFGINSAATRVVLLVHAPPGWDPSIARNRLERAGHGLAWDEIGEAFARSLPQEIRELEAETQSKELRGIDQAWKAELLGAFTGMELPRYRLDPQGSVPADCSTHGTHDRAPGDSHGTHSRTERTTAPDDQEHRSGPAAGPDRAHETKARRRDPVVPDVVFVESAAMDDERFLAQWATDRFLVNHEHSAYRRLYETLVEPDVARPAAHARARCAFEATIAAVLAEHAMVVEDMRRCGLVSSTEYYDALAPAVLAAKLYAPFSFSTLFAKLKKAKTAKDDNVVTVRAPQAPATLAA